MDILVRVIPWSKKIKIEKEWKDLLSWIEIYKVNLTAKPINWEANKQLIKVISEFFWIKKRFVSIYKWETNKVKLLKISWKP